MAEKETLPFSSFWKIAQKNKGFLAEKEKRNSTKKNKEKKRPLGLCPPQLFMQLELEEPAIPWVFCTIGAEIKSILIRKTFAKNLAPYRIGKRPHKQNRAKIPPKYRKSYFLSIFEMYFWAILRVAVFSCPVGGQVFPKKTFYLEPWRP